MIDSAFAAPTPTFRRPLTPQERRFVEEYLLDLDPRRAAVRAALQANDGPRFLTLPWVQDAIALAKRQRLSRTQIYADEVIRRLALVASADVSKIAPVFRVNCRHCWGVDHEYQFDDVEFRHARAEHQRAQLKRYPEDPDLRDDFPPLGGDGFRRRREPCRGPDWVERQALLGFENPTPTHDHTCPRCDGDGELLGVITDVRSLGPAELAIYEGFTYDARGNVSIKFRDRSKAEALLGQHAGIFNDKRPLDVFDPAEMTEDQLNAVAVHLIERGVVELEGEAVEIDNASYDPVDDAAP